MATRDLDKNGKIVKYTVLQGGVMVAIIAIKPEHEPMKVVCEEDRVVLLWQGDARVFDGVLLMGYEDGEPFYLARLKRGYMLYIGHDMLLAFSGVLENVSIARYPDKSGNHVPVRKMKKLELRGEIRGAPIRFILSRDGSSFEVDGPPILKQRIELKSTPEGELTWNFEGVINSEFITLRLPIL